MNIVCSLIPALLIIFNHIGISSASSSPNYFDFISQLDKKEASGSHQASSSHSHQAGEGLPETELRLNTNARPHMHFYLDYDNPHATPYIPTHRPSQVTVNHHDIPSTMMICEKMQFHFMSGFEYWVPLEYRKNSKGKLVPKKEMGYQILPGYHRALVNNFQEALAFEYEGENCSYITYRGEKVALRWDGRKLGVRFLEEAERTFLTNLEEVLKKFPNALQRRN